MMSTTDPARLAGGWIDPYTRPWARELESRADAILTELEGLLEREVWSMMSMTGRPRKDAPSFTRMEEDEIRTVARPQRGVSGGRPRARSGACSVCTSTGSGSSAIALCVRRPRRLWRGFRTWSRPASRAWSPAAGWTFTGAPTAPITAPISGSSFLPGDCGLRVSGETRRWEAGKMLMFDDTHLHEAWNETPEHRIVLIADVKWIERPLG